MAADASGRLLPLSVQLIVSCSFVSNGDACWHALVQSLLFHSISLYDTFLQLQDRQAVNKFCKLVDAFVAGSAPQLVLGPLVGTPFGLPLPVTCCWGRCVVLCILAVDAAHTDTCTHTCGHAHAHAFWARRIQVQIRIVARTHSHTRTPSRTCVHCNAKPCM